MDEKYAIKLFDDYKKEKKEIILPFKFFKIYRSVEMAETYLTYGK